MSKLNEAGSSSSTAPIVICGAGLTGCCVSLLLARRFPKSRIVIVENREDYRETLRRQREFDAQRCAVIAEAAAQAAANQAEKEAGAEEGQLNTKMVGAFSDAAKRSINLALSHRGIVALQACGMYDEIVKEGMLILMRGRMIHDLNGNTNPQLYGQDHQGIYSISRLTLNALFIKKLNECENVEFLFQHKVNRVDKEGCVTCTRTSDGKVLKLESKFVIGADGAYSSTRASLQRLCRADFSITYIKHGYKELTLRPDGETGAFVMAENYLHIWPRHEFMLIGLPNPDKTFTCTLFGPWNGPQGLDALDKDQDSLHDFFVEYFPDFVQLCPDFIEQCETNPSSPLAHVHLSPWNVSDKMLLLGDAAHAIVPFYGQGMNAAFEDCVILMELLDKYNNDIGKSFDEMSLIRQPSTDSLSDLSLQNYVEMRSLTAKRWFVWKKNLEKFLNKVAPDYWKPLYSMVAFSRIPYDEAVQIAQRQDRLLTLSLGIGIGAIAAGVIGVAVKQFDNKPRERNETNVEMNHPTSSIGDWSNLENWNVRTVGQFMSDQWTGFVNSWF